MTDTGSKSFDCALVLMLETYDDHENGNYINYDSYTYYGNYTYYDNCMIIILIIYIMAIILITPLQVAWSRSVHGLCTSSTTRNLFSTSSPSKEFWENFLLCLLVALVYWNHSAPPAQRLSGTRARQPQAGCRRRMQDVVCQLVGIGMVP